MPKSKVGFGVVSRLIWLRNISTNNSPSLRPIIVFFGAVAVGLHLALFLIPPDYTNIFLYVRNQFLAWSFLFSMVQILDFLKFHHMFGPWAIIISSLLVDLGKFMTVLFLFLIGFSMLVTAMNTPFYQLVPEVKAETGSYQGSARLFF